VLLMRPFETLHMSSAIVFRSGRLGFMAHGHPNATLFERGNHKTIHLNFTYYTQPVLVNDHHIEVVHNVVCHSVGGGSNCRFLNSAAEILSNSPNKGSLISHLVPARDLPYAPYMSIYGSWKNSSDVDNNMQASSNNLDANVVHFSGYAALNEVWKFRDVDQLRRRNFNDGTAMSVDGNGGGINYVICRERNEVYSPAAGKFVHGNSSSSHRGDRGSMPGARAVWQGQKAYFPAHTDLSVGTHSMATIHS
jgi:hypothetical protein